MAIGDKWEVYIPWQKAYGARGMPSVIPPYASYAATPLFAFDFISLDFDFSSASSLLFC